MARVPVQTERPAIRTQARLRCRGRNAFTLPGSDFTPSNERMAAHDDSEPHDHSGHEH